CARYRRISVDTVASIVGVVRGVCGVLRAHGSVEKYCIAAACRLSALRATRRAAIHRSQRARFTACVVPARAGVVAGAGAGAAVAGERLSSRYQHVLRARADAAECVDHRAAPLGLNADCAGSVNPPFLRFFSQSPISHNGCLLMPSLYKLRGMLPYLLAMFLNAFVDLGHKIVIQNTIFKMYDGHVQVILTAIVNGLILLPYILLFSPAGFLSDRFAKNSVMRVSAAAAVVLTLAITASYYLGWFEVAFAMTLLLGVQSAIYSPAKYGYLKPLVGKERLAEGNGVVQAVTIVAILTGTFAFSIVFELWFDRQGAADTRAILRAIAPLGWVLVICSVVEFYLTTRLPVLESGDSALRFSAADYVRGHALRENLDPLRRNQIIRLSIIGLSVFWAVSQVMLAAFPSFAKESLNIHNTVLLQGMLATSGIGIIIGSFLAGRFSQRHIETGLIPLGAAGIAAGLLWLPGLQSVTAHCLNFFLIGMMGGFFIVPLNALIQFHAGEHEMGKVLAANNLVQNIAMLGFLAVTALVATSGIKTSVLLMLIAGVALVGTAYTVL